MSVIFKRVQPVWMIIAISFAFAGCGGKDAVAPIDVEKQAWEDLRNEVREAIASPERESEVIALVDILERDMSALRGVVDERINGARQLNANYDATRAEFQSFLTKISKDAELQRKKAIQSHAALISFTTTDEWAQISKANTKAMKSTIKTMQAI